MDPHATAGEKDDDDIFTDKQRRVLDLLIEHKTSKEIARALGISPYTVDQRISLARAKLGVSSRNELAARYQAMRNTSDQSAAAISAFFGGEQAKAIWESDAQVASPADRYSDPLAYQSAPEDHLPAGASTDGEQNPCPTGRHLDYRVGPEVFEGRSGGLWRLGAVVATALFLVVTILGLFAIFNQLSDMLA